jgi:hypothetical protein
MNCITEKGTEVAIYESTFDRDNFFNSIEIIDFNEFE